MGMMNSRWGINGTVMFSVLLVLLPTVTGLAATDESGGRQELQRIKKELREKKQELKRADRQERSILSDLDGIDRDVLEGKAELADQQKKLHEMEVSLRDVEKSSEAVTSELSGLREVYARRVRALYKMSRNGSAAGLLAPGGTGDPFRRFRYLTLIAERDRGLIEEYGSALERLSVQQVEITQKRLALVERKRKIESEKNQLEARKRRKAILLASVRREKGLYEQTLHELEESSASLWAMIRKAEKERMSAKTGSGREGRSGAPSSDTARLSWPIEGQVLTKFGMQRHPQFNTMVFRRGIEISAHEGDAVRAVSDGQVVYADWYKGYGKLLIIEHQPGFYTLYGNLSQLDVAKGARVVRGQVVGLAGDTGSLKGSKLYFEVRRNGEAQDPLRWLARR
jgi:septal ring factor EnvC (AmiA/AmiB activator)